MKVVYSDILEERVERFIEEEGLLNNTDLILTDPPWNERILSTFYKRAGKRKRDLYSILDRLFSLSKRCLKEEGYLILNFSKENNVIRDLIKKHNFFLENELFSTYSNNIKEVYFVLRKKDFGKKSYHIELKGTNKTKAKKLIEKYGREGGNFIDFFAGKGTFLKAAEELGMNAFGVEIEEGKVKI